MNRQSNQILELGLFFGGAVIVLDVFLSQVQALDWFALGLIFFLASAIILGSVARTVPTQKEKSITLQQKEDEFQQLADTVNAAVYGHDRKSLRILTEYLKSLALGTVAAGTMLSKKEILELAENDKQTLEDVVKDEEMIKLLTGHQPRDEPLSEHEFEKMLSKIETWSR